MASNEKGDRRERELVHIFDQDTERAPEKYIGVFDDEQWAVMRAPASGAATERELPDLLVGDGVSFYAIEVKSSQRDEYIYLTEEEVDALLYFSHNFGAEPRVGVRYDYCEWAFFYPDILYRTDGGNYRVGEQDLPEGETFHDL